MANKTQKPVRTPIQRLFRQVRRNRFWLLIFLWLALAVPELILHMFTASAPSALFSSGLILGPLFALVPGMVLFFLCTAIPLPRLNYAIALTYSGLCLALCGAQAAFFRGQGRFFRLAEEGLLSGLERGLSEVWWVIFAMAVPFLILAILGQKLFSFRAIRNRRSHGILLLMAGAVQILLVLALPLFGGTGELSAYGLYRGPSDSYYSVNRLGAMTALRLDLARSPREQAPEPETAPPEASTAPLSPPAASVTFGEENRLDLDLALLAEQEQDPTIASIHRYFSTRTPSAKNSMTGLFRGCNLILISVEGTALPETDLGTAPILQKLVTEGVQFEEYYVPDWALSAEDGEYALLTGTLPTDSSFRDSLGDRMPLTLSQQLLKEGYSVFAFSGDSAPYREDFLENLGFESVNCAGSISTALDLIDRSTGSFPQDSPFFVYYLLPGDSITDLDEAIELLLARTEGTNTAILLTPVAVADAPGQEPEECRAGCILWKSGMEPVLAGGPTSIVDLLPTLSNLWGLEFDSRLYMGRDLFGGEEGLVLFRDRSWITGQAEYRSGAVTSRTGSLIDIDYVNKISTEASNRFSVSAWIPESDYWRELARSTTILNFS